MNTQLDSGDDLGCPKCGGGPIEIVMRTINLREEDARTAYHDELSKCSNCGEEFYTFEQAVAHSRAVTEATRAAEGLMSPSEIKATRFRLGMSQPQFEHALGVGKKTVGRWEKGTVPPSGAANGLLWFASRYPQLFLEYARERGFNFDRRIIEGTVAAILPGGPNEPPIVLKGPRTSVGTEFITAPNAPVTASMKVGQV